jgi:hypothetical protein
VSPAAGTTRYFCPLECGWSDIEPLNEPPSLGGLSIPESMAAFADSAWWREAQQKEQKLFEHLATHTTEQFVRTIQCLRAEVAALRERPAGSEEPTA